MCNTISAFHSPADSTHGLSTEGWNGKAIYPLSRRFCHMGVKYLRCTLVCSIPNHYGKNCVTTRNHYFEDFLFLVLHWISVSGGNTQRTKTLLKVQPLPASGPTSPSFPGGPSSPGPSFRSCPRFDISQDHLQEVRSPPESCHCSIFIHPGVWPQALNTL